MATEYWTKQDGSKISVDDMDLNHLRNTLKMIIRKSRGKSKKLITPISSGFQLNGDMAQQFIEDNMDADLFDEGDGPDWDQGCRD